MNSRTASTPWARRAAVASCAALALGVTSLGLAQVASAAPAQGFIASPNGMVGLQQLIAVGPMAGKSNAAFVLERLGIEPTEECVQRVLAAGKSSKRLLTDAEVRAAAAP